MKTTPNLALPYPESTDTADVPRDVKALADKLDALSGPAGLGLVGEIKMWPAVNAPTGYLICNGQQVPAATYPGLAAVLGQAGGNVTVPDYRDMFPVGASATNAVGATGGLSAVTLTAAQSGMPGHNHGGLTGVRDRSQAHAHPIGSVWLAMNIAGGLFTGGAAGATAQGTSSGIAMESTDAPDHLHSIAAEAARNATTSHENRPPFRAVNFIIRAG
jgi:microcystin-dependent protein